MDRRAVLMTSLAAPLTLVGWPGIDRPVAGPVRAAGPDPGTALTDLLAGNQRFVQGRARHGHQIAAARAATGDQHPIAVVLGCLDSRVPVEAVFDQGFGAVCVVRSGGAVLDRAVLGSVDYAVGPHAVPLVLVLGHSRCGAVQAAIDTVRGGARPDGELGYLVDEIVPAVRAAGGEPVEATRRQVRRTAATLAERPSLRDRAAAGTLTVAGAVYDLDTGRVELVP